MGLPFGYQFGENVGRKSASYTLDLLAESLESRLDNDLDLRILDLVSSHTYQIFYLLTYLRFRPLGKTGA